VLPTRDTVKAAVSGPTSEPTASVARIVTCWKASSIETVPLVVAPRS